MSSPAPIQVILLHKNTTWIPREEPIALQLELLLVGDPKRRQEGKEWMELADAIPLHEEINLFSFTSPPTEPEEAGAFLDDGLHSLVVALVDSDLLADDSLLDWLAKCAKHSGTNSGQHRFLPVMRGDETKQAWEGLKGRSELKSYQTLDFSQTGERSERMDWLGLRVLYEILHMAAVGAGAARAWMPQIFVSHSKKGGLSLAKGLRDLVGQIPWLAGFYDACDIGNSCPWEQELEAAVASSVLVALRTDQYDHRPYCQKEILWAERYGVPMVLVDARLGAIHAASRLPFESAPCVRISDGNLVRVLHAALRVMARAQVFGRWVTWLRQARQKNELESVQVISVSPGISALAAACELLRQRPDGPRLLFFPGPLQSGYEQAAAALAFSAGVELCSPVIAFRQNLRGLRVGISVSESDDLARSGATKASVNRLIVTFSRALLAEGASLAFGHDWRDEGIMNALCNYALESQGMLTNNPEDPAILNLVPWPDRTEVAHEHLDALEGILKVDPACLPEALRRRVPPGELTGDEDLVRYLRSRGLTHLRRALVTRSGARICVGGRGSRFAGRYPGVLEEALLSLEAKQPVYFVGLLGGVSKLMGHAILDQMSLPPDLERAPFEPAGRSGRAMIDLYRDEAQAGPQDNENEDEKIDLTSAFERFRTFGAEQLGKLNGLSEPENRLLLETRIEQEAIHLVLRGLRKKMEEAS